MLDHPPPAEPADDPFTTRVYAVLHRVFSALWMVLAASLGLYAHGSTLTTDAVVLRQVVPALAALVAMAMLVRLLAPTRTGWTWWALPLTVGLCFCTFALSAFGVAGLGATAPRIGVTGLIGAIGAFALAHCLASLALDARVPGVRP